MTIRALSGWLLQNPGFLERYRAVTVDSVLRQFGGAMEPIDAYVHYEHDWQYLLNCAVILAGADDGDAQAAALRIAQHCLSLPNVPSNLRDSAALVLDGLLNYPAIGLAINRGLLEDKIESRLAFPARLDWVRRSAESTIFLSNDAVLKGNRFQQRFWASTEENDWISISAPTSAGKSFIVEHWVAEFLRQVDRATVVYVVPTRALINQVETDLSRFLLESGVVGVSVSSAPMRQALVPGHANVFVFTQERLHIFLSSFDQDPRIDALVVDEAHKVGDRHRGVLLQQVIERVAALNRDLKVMFASPLADNPEVLLADAARDIRRESFVAEDVTVNQNLLWASQDRGRPKNWTVALCLADDILPIGQVRLAFSPAPESKRLPFFAYAVGGHRPGNIIYVNGARDAERTAQQLYDAMGSRAEIVDNPEIDALIELAEKTIHPQFLLAKVLRRGVAFHYGNMPLLVRTEIERLFSQNVIHYLICTSTLVEGVNMACRNIFLRGPQKGYGNLMSDEDFWNLAGRAGRWGKEFQGNIFCVDASRASLWEGGVPPRSRVRYSIERTADAVLTNSTELIDYIAGGTPRDIARRRSDLEYMVSYLTSIHLRYGSIGGSPWSSRYRPDQLAVLDTVLGDVVARLRTPAWVIYRNPGISPLAMDNLLSHFDQRADRVEDLIPADPASDDAPASYAAIFARISRNLSLELGPEGGRGYMLALLVARWMRGFPLSRLITDRIEYHARREDGTSVGTAIRSVMEEVERIARFEAPKHLACYVDLLRVFLAEINRSDLMGELTDLGVLLEFGVSQQTQVSLILLGLSRTSSVNLSEIIANDELSEVQALEWLEANDWASFDLPALVKREIAGVLQKQRRKVA